MHKHDVNKILAQERSLQAIPSLKLISLDANQQKVHTLRALMIVIDMSRSIQMKDFKPSRLNVVLQMIKLLVHRAKDATPSIKFCLALVEQEHCKIKLNFTHDDQALNEIIDSIKAEPDPGFFSLEDTITMALEAFESVQPEYHKELLIIQTSSSTKDCKDIMNAIRLFKKSRISLNIISMVGWVRIFKKLASQCAGKYITVDSSNEFKTLIEQISLPEVYDSATVRRSQLKLALCRKEYDQNGKHCFCHFKKTSNYYICNNCEAILCRQPPYECCVCTTLVILPTDLSRHKFTT